MVTYLVQQWPHSRALGQRWVSFPLSCPVAQPWPGLRFYATESKARAR